MGTEKNTRIYCFNPAEEQEGLQRDRTVYHYTSPEGLMAILSAPSVRFTDCQYLNDKSEYTHIHIPLEEAFEEVRDFLHDTDLCDMIQNFITDKYDYQQIVSDPPTPGFKNMKMFSMRHFVFCASTESDSLNMWNYYVKGGNYQGYNIGFSVKNIVESFAAITDHKISLFYGPVIYKSKEQVTLIKHAIIDTDEALHKALLNEADPVERDLIRQDYYAELLMHIERLRLFFKNEAFSSEKEYRFVIRMPVNADTSKGALRTGYTIKKGVITPHCDVSFAKTGVVKGITIAPIMETELAKIGLTRFLADNGYGSKVDIDYSDIPIRY